MTILAGDIKLIASQVMDDVPEGGGAPSSTIITDGNSNAIFADISEVDRAGGAVSLRKLFVGVHTNNVDTLLDGNVIVAVPPADPNVSVTLVGNATMFDRRTDAEDRIESYLVRGPEISGYLLENHVQGQKSLEIFQRVGELPPTVGRTLCLVYLENMPAERLQYVRVIRNTITLRSATVSTSGGFLDYAYQVVTSEISDALRFDFPGSPPSRLYSQDMGKTHIRDTTVADAFTSFGVARLASDAAIGDITIDVESVYSQLVPSARTETSALDQRPASERVLTLAEAPRLVAVGAAAHSKRTKIGQENRGFNYVEILKPFPAPGTVAVSFRALDQWYELSDDGAGNLTGSGVGTVNYANGSIAVTLPSMPDDNSALIYQWGEKTGFNNRAGLLTFRAPEYAIKLEKSGIKPSTVAVHWLSGGVAKTAVDNGSGVLSGHAVGEVNYAAGMLFIRPTAMLDPGGQFSIDYQWSTMKTKAVAATPDSGGYILITLDDVPVAGSVSVSWRTTRTVSNSSGTTSGGNSTKTTSTKTSNVAFPSNPPAPPAGTPAPPKPAVVMTRIATDKPGSYQQYMAPGGIRTSTGERVWIEITAQLDAQGFYYALPDVTGVQWSELDWYAYAKIIGDVTYERWTAADHNGVGGPV